MREIETRNMPMQVYRREIAFADRLEKVLVVSIVATMLSLMMLSGSGNEKVEKSIDARESQVQNLSTETTLQNRF
jgi:cell division protein FtsL